MEVQTLEHSNLAKTIEQLRQQLQELVQQKGTFLDDEVIKKSQELDRKLNEYEKLLKKQQE